MGQVEFRDAELRVEGEAFDQMHSIDANWNVEELPDTITPHASPCIRTHAERTPGNRGLFS